MLLDMRNAICLHSLPGVFSDENVTEGISFQMLLLWFVIVANIVDQGRFCYGLFMHLYIFVLHFLSGINDQFYLT